MLMVFFGCYLGLFLVENGRFLTKNGDNIIFSAIMAIFAVIQRLNKRKKIDDLESSEGQNGVERSDFDETKVNLDKNYGLPAYTDIVLDRTAF